MVELRYPLSSLVFDYFRGIVVVAMSALILWSVGTDTPIFWVFVGLIVLFLLWLGHTALRHISWIRFDEQGLQSRPWPKKDIAWSALEDMALRYYSTKRNRKNGWMTLTLKSQKNRIELESTLPHFTAIVARAAYAANEARLTLDPITLENMSAIGVSDRGVIETKVENAADGTAGEGTKA